MTTRSSRSKVRSRSIHSTTRFVSSTGSTRNSSTNGEKQGMVDTQIAPGALATDIYERIGVRTVINGRGATTAVGGSLMRPEVTAAMVEASKAFVVIEELNAKVGEKIAEITGAEA